MQLSRVNPPMSCKYGQFGVPSTPSPQLLTPLSSPQSLPGSALPPKLGCIYHAAAPSAPDAAARAKFSSLTVAARGLLRWHGWTHNPEWRPLLSEPATPRALSSQTLRAPLFSTNPGQRKTRASPSRENTVISRYFVLPAPTPPPSSGARDLAQKIHLGDA